MLRGWQCVLGMFLPHSVGSPLSTAISVLLLMSTKGHREVKADFQSPILCPQLPSQLPGHIGLPGVPRQDTGLKTKLETHPREVCSQNFPRSSW